MGSIEFVLPQSFCQGLTVGLLYRAQALFHAICAWLQDMAFSRSTEQSMSSIFHSTETGSFHTQRAYIRSYSIPQEIDLALIKPTTSLAATTLRWIGCIFIAVSLIAEIFFLPGVDGGGALLLLYKKKYTIRHIATVSTNMFCKRYILQL